MKNITENNCEFENNSTYGKGKTKRSNLLRIIIASSVLGVGLWGCTSPIENTQETPAKVSEQKQDLPLTDNSFDETSVKVFSESSYLLSGQTYHAQAIVAAWQNNQATAYVRWDDGPEKEYSSDEHGVIHLDYDCGVGQHMYTGYVKRINPSTNQMDEYPLQGSFSVVPPSVSVTATKMNVVYRGVENPIAVGGAFGETSATASSGTLTKTDYGTYILRPEGDNEVTISVSSQGSSLGSMKFRVKDLPKPTVFIRNVVNGQVSKNALLAAGCVEAELKDFDFEGAHFDVVGYSFIYKTKSGTIKEAKASSGVFTDEIKTIISQANEGDMFLFNAIQVRGNDGKVKTLESGIGVFIK